MVEKMLIDESYIEEVKEKYSLFDFLKVSSKTGENVDLAFQKIGAEIVRNIDSRNVL